MLSEKWLSMSRHPARSGHCTPYLADLVRVYHLLLIPCPIWSELRNLVITDHPFRFFADVEPRATAGIISHLEDTRCTINSRSVIAEEPIRRVASDLRASA
ncbi:hypothetical protein BD310DRAFT_926002 [Dichomitus squalens]|uniref:Uncharacterized protein n=1 Tax=Dichomitus squalens TaxID=114155 RepID=A0A4Q9PWQ8_9APHY|nr:hypothetical protein BD310DRAFT_926002 [Dichomitus squalens]